MTISTFKSTESRRFLRLSGVFAAALFVLGAGAAHAQPRPFETQPNALEFRGYALIQAGLEDDIWRLAADGSARLVYLRRGGHAECNAGGGCQGSDAGTWSRANGQICVNWQTRTEISGCYAIVPQAGIHVRLVGPVAFEGTLEAA